MYVITEKTQEHLDSLCQQVNQFFDSQRVPMELFILGMNLISFVNFRSLNMNINEKRMVWDIFQKQNSLSYNFKLCDKFNISLRKDYRSFRGWSFDLNIYDTKEDEERVFNFHGKCKKKKDYLFGDRVIVDSYSPRLLSIYSQDKYTLEKLLVKQKKLL